MPRSSFSPVNLNARSLPCSRSGSRSGTPVQFVDSPSKNFSGPGKISGPGKNAKNDLHGNWSDTRGGVVVTKKDLVEVLLTPVDGRTTL